MKNLQETMRELQKTSESLAKLNFNQEHPWQALSQMNQILDANFWESLVKLTGQTASQATAQASEAVAAMPKKQKKEKVRPIVMPRSSPEAFPVTDIYQTEHLLIVCCELPGFARDSLEVTLTEQRTLEIKGAIKKHPYAASCIRQERAFGTFSRQIELPVSVSAKGMKAQYQDGLLELYLPRDGSPRERKTTFRANL
ncbi:Hsp20/alpha crystallin family protein [Brevibacillus sp. GCM10020057]|uniref:Hsp20/alpha crystallin family protein n=1 Tax=Brevibacillus sp. GCM10020057 TaxID=3317327 RepID=UPI00362F1710